MTNLDQMREPDNDWIDHQEQLKELAEASKPTDPLAAMRNAMENALEYRQLESANDGNAYYRGMADREQRRAIMLAVVAQAYSLERIAESLERALPVLGRIATGLEEPLP